MAKIRYIGGQLANSGLRNILMQLPKYVHQCNIMNVMYYAILRNFQSSFNYLSVIIDKTGTHRGPDWRGLSKTLSY